MAKILSFLPYSASTPFANKTHPPLSISSKTNASTNNGYPLASKIIIKNLPFSTSQSRLLSEFSKYGQIAEVKLAQDEAIKRSKGYAFIQYTLQEEAMLALESMDHQFFDGRKLFVEIVKPRRTGVDGYPKTSGPPRDHLSLERNDEATEDQAGNISASAAANETNEPTSEEKVVNVVCKNVENEWDRLLRVRWEKYQNEEEASLGRGKRQRKAVSYREAYVTHPKT